MDLEYSFLKKRVTMFGSYIAETGATVRETAKRFGYSKSTVHKDISEHLRDFAPGLYAEVRSVLDKNKAERHLRGGLATKRKYKQKKYLSSL